MEDKAKEEWLNTYKPSTRNVYKICWRYFQEFTGLTGDQVLESRKADKEYYWEKQIIAFKNWMMEKKHKGENTATTAAMSIRGFFAYHRMKLEFRRTEREGLAEAKPKYEDYRFSREDLQRMCDHANLQEEYVVKAGKSFGLRAGDFLALTRGDLEPYVNREVPISIGEYVTEKKTVLAYPFIDRDALPLIKLMIEKMEREGRTKPTDTILTYSDDIQLSRVIKRLVKRTGIKVGRKRVRFHCLRKYLIDRLSSFMSESKWKQIVGKKISEGAYVSPDLLRDDYSRAMSETCFTEKIAEGDIEAIAKKQALMIIAKNAGYTESEIKTIFREHGAKNIDEEIAILEDIGEKHRIALRERATNGGDCDKEYQQIPEVNLLGYLRAGWSVVHRLQNGEVIISKE